MKKLLLIDGHSILNRAYYGLPDLTNSAGLHTNAVYGFLNMMLKYMETEEPTHLFVAFDVNEPTFRHKMYAEYKGTRKPMDPELREQVPMTQKMLSAMGIPMVKQGGYEADDILGTMARAAEEEGFLVTIVSGDRDLLQLATEKTKISIPKTKRGGTEIENYFAKDVLEQKGVTPEEFIDVKALWGDTSDNIPGVPGIGEKTATAIISTYHSIENAYEHVTELKPPKASKNLAEYYEQAVMSKELATIEVHADIPFMLSEGEIGSLFTEEAYLLCREWELKSLLPRFEKREEKGSEEQRFHEIRSMTEWEEKAKTLPATLGYSLGFLKREPFFLSVSDGEETFFLSGREAFLSGQLTEILQGLLDSGKHLVSREIKEDVKQLSVPRYECLDDVSLMAYLLNPLKSEYPSEDIAKEYLGELIPSFLDLFGKLKGEKAFLELPEETMKFFCHEARTAVKAVKPLREALAATGMEKLYDEIELPLCFTLADMECAGIAMDRKALLAFGEELSVHIKELEKKIYEAAGEEFNINSPKQLGEILFGRLGLPNGKKTKTGYSTAAEVLEKLAPEYPIVEDILTYRQYAKLKSTYVDGLSEAVSEDGRVHSTFQQTVTATGRISCTEPNLQNIPIRMELGKQIRKVFYPGEGCVFLDADYSQIELRVLAHLSGDPNLIEAYRQGQDIHRSTASLVFHTPFEEVTELQRRNAKAVNFGIVYGISAFGLSRDLSIDTKEAQAYINNYFHAYPVLHQYLENLKTEAKEKGYALTLFGRRRPVPELSSANFMQRQFGERVAMNSPIQGTAADIIKIAMVRVHDRLKAEGLRSRLILQVHDELLIETFLEEKEAVLRLMEEEMQNAASLSVNLDIDVHEGENWYDAK